MQKLRDRCEIRIETCIFTLSHARYKFKFLVAICKKASLTRQKASFIDNFILNKGYGKWFGQLFPLVQSRESAQPEQAIEPSMETIEVVIEKNSNKGLHVQKEKESDKKVQYLLMQCQNSINSLIRIPLKPLSSISKKRIIGPEGMKKE